MEFVILEHPSLPSCQPPIAVRTCSPALTHGGGSRWLLRMGGVEIMKCDDHCVAVDRCRHWKNNIRRDLREVCTRDETLLVLTQDRTQWRTFVNTAMNFRVP